MSDVKKPNAGEWWVRNDDGAIVYICGCDPDGDPVFMDDDEELHNGMLRFFTQEYHHEPRCTGFDWFEPLEPWKTIDVDPGDGYRWLDAEEFVEATDEVFRPDLNPMWVKPLTRTGYMCYHDNYPVRRKIEQPEALARVQHPTMDCPDCGEFRGHGHVCRPASLDPDDVPLNPVPGKVVATGTVTLNPVESPDDWVEYDPAHITCPRVSVDWLTPRLGESQWGPALLVWSDATWAAQPRKLEDPMSSL